MKTGIIGPCGGKFSGAIVGGLFECIDGDNIGDGSDTVAVGLLNWFSWSTKVPIKYPIARPLTFVSGLGIGIRCSRSFTIGF